MRHFCRRTSQLADKFSLLGRKYLRGVATDMTSIKAIAVSLDGKLVALGESSGHVEIWELR